MSIKVIKPGLQASLVGAARTGYRTIGIGTGGAMDAFAMQVANYLVGNTSQNAVLEIYNTPSEILFEKNLLISITGKGVEVYVNGKFVPMWKPHFLQKNSVVTLKPTGMGGRVYLGVAGGWQAEEWLGSASTHMGVEAGGFMGRALKKGDQIKDGGTFNSVLERILFPWGISRNELDRVYMPLHTIRFVTTAETILLKKQSQKVFCSSSFTIITNSNKMGFRLSGTPLVLNSRVELVSSPVDTGTIQLLPDGNLIVLMAEHQTTGGYPRIGSVVKADLPKLAQLNPTDKITFHAISLTEAEALFMARENQLEKIRKSCLLHLFK